MRSDERRESRQVEGARPSAAAIPRERDGARAASAQLRWSTESHSTELEINGDQGLLLIPVKAHGPDLAALLLEALDRAAPGGRRHVQISRGSLLLELSFPDEWPAAEILPSEVLGTERGESPRRPQSGVSEGEEDRLRTALGALDESAARDLSDYPRRRKALASERRRVEHALFRIEETATGFRRAELNGLIASIAALVAAGTTAMFGMSRLLLVSAIAFLMLSILMLFSRFARTRVAARRSTLERVLATVGERETLLEKRTRFLSSRLGQKDPWEAAARVAKLTSAESGSSPRPEPTAKSVLETARSLARNVGLAPEKIDWKCAALEAVATDHRAWPVEVAARGSSDVSAPILIALARLIERVSGSLSIDWPVVLWNPWPGAPPRDRARLLLAAAETIRPRPLVVLVDASAE